MEEEFRAILLSSIGLSALVGDRINWGAHPQGQAFPAIVLNTISDIDGITMDGPMRLTQGRVQADCYADTYGVAKLLSRAVLSVLHGYSSGALQGVFHAGSRESRESGPTEADRPFRVSIDFETVFNKG